MCEEMYKRRLTEIQANVGGLVLERYQTLQSLTRALCLKYTKLLVRLRSSLPSTPANKEERRHVGGWEGGSRRRPIRCLALYGMLYLFKKSPLASEIRAIPLHLPNATEEAKAPRLRTPEDTQLRCSGGRIWAQAGLRKGSVYGARPCPSSA